VIAFTDHFTSFAVLLVGETSDPGSSSEDSSAVQHPNETVPKGAIIGIVVGAVVFVIIGMIAVYFVVKKRRREENEALEMSHRTTKKSSSNRDSSQLESH
jgi:hypothetical protein